MVTWFPQKWTGTDWLHSAGNYTAIAQAVYAPHATAAVTLPQSAAARAARGRGVRLGRWKADGGTRGIVGSCDQFAGRVSQGLGLDTWRILSRRNEVNMLRGISRRLFGSEWHPIEDVMRWQARWLSYEEYSFQFLLAAQMEGCREARQKALFGGVSVRRGVRDSVDASGGAGESICAVPSSAAGALAVSGWGETPTD
jgi:hypothetical protein